MHVKKNMSSLDFFSKMILIFSTTADKMCVSDHFEEIPPANQIQMITVIAVMFTLENHA